MYNPFEEHIEEDKKDTDYIAKALQGDSVALEALVLRHQSWIFNISLRMTGGIQDAEDATQEALIKIITKLSSYDPQKASFRTWLYRVVTNHVINMKEGKMERTVAGLLEKHDINDLASSVPDRRKSSKPEHGLMVNETKISCVNCMLLCLDRRERMIFILGVVFNVPDKIGSGLCGVTKVNFRKILSRSRKKIHDFFDVNCSLLHEDNPCRCGEKIRPLIKLGLVDTDNLFTAGESAGSINEMLGGSIREIEDSYYEFNSLFRNQPFFRGPDMVDWLRNLLNKNDFRNILNLN
ncbi:MAG: RNA polymerase sigma factor [Spirochaetes bacterium]|jgi:RNA polymerase sigma factor (sigma-70 family)|nr:RNA polymerase sigma factor [Spirochaetota bacterium]